ncbi:MAG: S8 family serine peptidase [bacterium]
MRAGKGTIQRGLSWRRALWITAWTVLLPAAGIWLADMRAAQAQAGPAPVLEETPGEIPDPLPRDPADETHPRIKPGQNPMEPVKVFIRFKIRPGNREEQLLALAGGKLKRKYERIVNAFAAEMPLAAVSQLEILPTVAGIEYDKTVYAADFELDNAWGVQHIHSEVCHAGGIKGGGVKVGVIDTGVNYNHPDIAGNYRGGYDFVNKDSDPQDDNSHGSHVAGILAALDNSQGVVGVAPKVELYALKVLNQYGNGGYSDIVAALEWSVTNGIQVVNLSLGSVGDPGTTVEQAFANAAAAGLVIVAAAGNQGNAEGTGDNVIYPARYQSVIAVAALNPANQRAVFSSTGPAVELAAPGVDILSIQHNGPGYTTKSGTSMASPHVAGAAALLIDAGISSTLVRTALQLTADDLGNPGRDSFHGFGLVDPVDAANPPANLAGPDVRIIEPAEGSDYALGEAVHFVGQALDPEEEDLSDNLWWSSSRDGGPFLPGSASWYALLTEGDHVITAMGYDAGDKTDSDSITISILNHPPVVTITHPSDGAVFDPGTVLTFTATVSDIDPVDKDLTSAGLVWTSSNGEWLGTGSSISVVLSEGAHRITAAITDTHGKTGEATITVTAGGLFTTSTDIDNGRLGAKGSLSFDPLTGTYTVLGSGDDIGNRADAFHFVYKEWQGDFDFQADVNLGGGNPAQEWSKAGLMARKNLTPGSVNLTARVRRTGEYSTQWRPVANGKTYATPSRLKAYGLNPGRQRLVRRGNTFSTYYLGKSNQWVLVDKNLVVMADPILVGFCVGSHDPGVLATGMFRNASLQASSGAYANLFEEQGDIRGDLSGAKGAMDFDPWTGVYLIQGNSGDAAGMEEAFHYAYKRWSGDFNLVADVSIQDGNAGQTGIKAFLMARQNLLSGAVNLSLRVRRDGQCGTQWRTGSDTPEASQDSQEPAAGRNPNRYRLERTGNTFSAYFMNRDGNWILADRREIEMTDPILVGLGVAGKDSGKNATGSFRNVVLE